MANIIRAVVVNRKEGVWFNVDKNKKEYGSLKFEESEWVALQLNINGRDMRLFKNGVSAVIAASFVLLFSGFFSGLAFGSPSTITGQVITSPITGGYAHAG